MGEGKPGLPNRVINDERLNPSASLIHRDAVVLAERRRAIWCREHPRVVTDYFPRRPLPAGDPASPSGTKVELSELADDVLAAIGSGGGGTLVVAEVDGIPSISPTTQITVPNNTLTLGAPGEAVLDFNAFDLREVVLAFSTLVAVGTALDIQTGVYAGAGSPAGVDGDIDVTLPLSGALFKGDGRIEVHLNGNELTKGDGSGNGEAEWVSPTQIKLNIKIKNKGAVLVRAPFPTA